MTSQPQNLRVALAGNPNAGKTTVFNALTGARQHVGNWPGKTVEQKSGTFIYEGTEYEVIDLPGTYSLSAYSIEEVITRDYILDEKPDVVVAVVDASNLERNLYLAVQLLELDVPVIVALNMMDSALSAGIKINDQALSAQLGVPVIPMTARRNQGMDNLIQAIRSAHKNGTAPHAEAK